MEVTAPVTHRTNMKNSDSAQGRAAELLDQVAGLLDEQAMARQIDDPIDEALEQFSHVEHEPYSHQRFIETTARFVQHVYEHALSPSRKLTLSQARDETVTLLGRAYMGMSASGYEGAILDAANPSGPGLELVLARLAEAIKRDRRQMHMHYVESRYIDSADWSTKCAMASIVIQRCREFLPTELQGCPPEQLAEDVFDLLALHLVTTGRPRLVHAASW